MVEVGLFDGLKRRRGAGKPGTLRRASDADLRHLEGWAAARRGVEAFVEPRTTVTETTVVLVAHDGEWTRRRIGSLDAAQQFGRKHSIPVYEVAKVGYPKRMREYTERQKRAGG
ncbi:MULTISPECIES: oxidoreductase [Amycolatopsis]|uniref:Oxidoreductase n=1 Tax=Amycolatopsis thermalba TaxID=944492 RepID=A0ABY4P296_9PSEU|nr:MULTISPECIES: oxidoreductase [Amycolatopsis]OXM73423.1 oxidoreductase [Amycolatopsis sp. KNN50.9b]UQS26482.1 oxidoreductase [Amycolatopsis thermalba]